MLSALVTFSGKLPPEKEDMVNIRCQLLTLGASTGIHEHNPVPKIIIVKEGPDINTFLGNLATQSKEKHIGYPTYR